MSESHAARSSSTYRNFPGRRWLVVVLRGVHLVGVVGVGARLLGAAPGRDGIFVVMLVASGVSMLALDAWSNREYLLQYSGAAMLAKLALLGWLVVADELRLPAFWAILALSALVAHAPARVRHRRLISVRRT